MSKGRRVPAKTPAGTSNTTASMQTYWVERPVWRIIRPWSNDFQQWLWYTEGRHNRIARFVCEQDIPIGDCNSYEAREAFIIALLEKITWRLHDEKVFVSEDDFTDSPRFIAPERLGGQVAGWWVEYLTARGFPRATSQDVSTHKRFRILRRDDYRCQLCGMTATDGVQLQVDHVVPRWRGGSAFEWNLWVLCRDCNHGKSGGEL